MQLARSPNAKETALPLFPCTEIAKRLNAIIAQILPFLSQEHQQQVASAVERAKQVTMTELNAIIGQQRPDLPRLLQQMHAAHLPAHGAPPLPLLGQGALPPAGLLGLGVPHHPLSVLAKPPEIHRPDDKGNEPSFRAASSIPLLYQYLQSSRGFLNSMFACFRIADGYASGDIGSCAPDSLPQIVPTRMFAQTKQTLAATLLEASRWCGTGNPRGGGGAVGTGGCENAANENVTQKWIWKPPVARRPG
ncbi:Protein groucho-2 [Papilio machaon]|uniref:Protein groucho-2 n=1 Tax=Papilio machaon TaxID=76193 RepID=A0A194RII8_PAPMA|nr:Protein groucho-2 [Papilio machaon]